MVYLKYNRKICKAMFLARGTIAYCTNVARHLEDILGECNTDMLNDIDFDEIDAENESSKKTNFFKYKTS